MNSILVFFPGSRKVAETFVIPRSFNLPWKTASIPTEVSTPNGLRTYGEDGEKSARCRSRNRAVPYPASVLPHT